MTSTDTTPTRSLAANPALDTPTSTTISCLLMEDTVDGGLLSVADGPNTIALFSYPLVGKQEALVVNESGLLTYLKRTASGTGWEQRLVFLDGDPVSVSEVVVVVHHVDQSVWAIYAPKNGGAPAALQLVTPASGGLPQRYWDQRKSVIFRSHIWNKVRHLAVSYCGRVPVVTGIDEKTFLCYSLHATADTPNGRGGMWRFADKRGPNLRVMPVNVVGVTADVNGPTTFFAQWADGTLTRDGGGMEPHLLSFSATRIVGTYRLSGTVGVGVLYLEDTDRDLRELVACTSGPSGPIAISTPGLHYYNASSWSDVDGMVHIYGVDDHDVLKVVHQAGWDSYAIPLWSRSTVHGAEPPKTVVACLPLEPNIGEFVLDDYPDATPSLLWQRQGATVPSDQFGIDTQDLTSALWTRERIRPPEGETHKVTHYVSTVTVLDQRGRALPNLPVTVTADIQGEVRIDNASYLVGPEHTVAVKTNALGKVVIASPADSLMPPTLHVDAVGMQNGAHIQPAAEVHDYLSGTGTLGSQKGRFTGDKLHESGIATGNGTQCDDAAKSCSDVFGITHGKPVYSAVRTSAGGGPEEIHGFSFGRSLTPDPATGLHEVTRIEFGSAQELEDHLDEIRRQANYGGIWEDFKKWAGDVWEGIRRGVIAVEHAIVNAAEATIHLFVKIGEEVVEAGRLIIDGLISAVHAVEAVIRQVVAAIVKVIDWLKALFDFEDIWETKQALEAGVHTMLEYGNTVVAHYAEHLDGWFPAQKKKVHDYFKVLEAEYYHQPLGNTKNIIPPLHDASGGPTTADKAVGNPQATWLADRVGGASATAAGDASFALLDPAALKPLTSAWQTFMDAVENSGILAEAKKTFRDIDALLRRIADPGDPNQGNATVLGALFAVLEDLVDIVLDLLHLLVDAVVALVAAVAAGIGDVLGWKPQLGPINALYEWIQPDGEPKEELTLGGLIALIGGFVVDIVYKLVHGVDAKVFPGGKFPQIPPPTFGGVRPATPALSAAEVNALKYTAGALNTAGMGFAGVADVAPTLGGRIVVGRFASVFIASMNALCGATFAGLVGALPEANGKTWDDAALDGGFAFAAVNAAGGWGTVGAFLAGQADTPAFKNIGAVETGPIVTMFLSLARVVCAVADGPKTELAKATIGMSAVPGLIQIFRIGCNTPAAFERAAFVAVIDCLACAVAGGLTMASALS